MKELTIGETMEALCKGEWLTEGNDTLKFALINGKLRYEDGDDLSGLEADSKYYLYEEKEYEVDIMEKILKDESTTLSPPLMSRFFKGIFSELRKLNSKINKIESDLG